MRATEFVAKLAPSIVRVVAAPEPAEVAWTDIIIGSACPAANSFNSSTAINSAQRVIALVIVGLRGFFGSETHFPSVVRTAEGKRLCYMTGFTPMGPLTWISRA